VRNLTAPLILVLALAGPATARDIYLHKHTVAEIKSDCDKVGGQFSQDPSGYGCGTDCHGKTGTACTVFCPADHRCVAQVIGGRRPRHVEDALEVSARHRH